MSAMTRMSINEMRFQAVGDRVAYGPLFSPSRVFQRILHATPRLLGRRRTVASQSEAFADRPTALLHEEADVSGSPRPESFEAGEVFAGRYRMVARIGRGDTADVWHADDLLLHTPVALKLIRSTSAAVRTQILNEVSVARQVTHPAVCRVFDVGETDHTAFCSMELVRGDLKTLLKRAGRLPSEKVIDIGAQLCAGVAAAHAKGVLHRDLKLANVLIDEDGFVKIADFGLAVTRADVDGTVGTRRLVAAGHGKASFASEQADVHALAVVLYELLTGQHPFNRMGHSRRVLRPSVLFPDVNPQLERALMNALATRVHDRPISAAAFAASLPTVESGPVSGNVPSSRTNGRAFFSTAWRFRA